MSLSSSSLVQRWLLSLTTLLASCCLQVVLTLVLVWKILYTQKCFFFQTTNCWRLLILRLFCWIRRKSLFSNKEEPRTILYTIKKWNTERRTMLVRCWAAWITSQAKSRVSMTGRHPASSHLSSFFFFSQLHLQQSFFCCFKLKHFQYFIIYRLYILNVKNWSEPMHREGNQCSVFFFLIYFNPFSFVVTKTKNACTI